MATNQDATLILDQNQPLPTPGEPMVISGPANEQTPLDPSSSTTDQAETPTSESTDGPQTEPQTDTQRVNKVARVAAGVGVGVGATLGAAGTAFASDIKDAAGNAYDSVTGVFASDENGIATPAGGPVDDPNAPTAEANEPVITNNNPQPGPAPQTAPAQEPQLQNNAADNTQPTPETQTTAGGDLHGQAVDMTGDGQADGVAVDADHDGKLEGVMVDQTGDGKVDMVIVDHDEDSVVDAILVDQNQDGNAEGMLVDLNNDGQMEALVVDTDNDGNMDTTILDTNQDGQYGEGDEVHAVTQNEAVAAFGDGTGNDQPDGDATVHNVDQPDDYENDGNVNEWA